MSERLVQYLIDSDDAEAADVVRSLVQERDEARAAMKEMRSIMEQQIDRAEAERERCAKIALSVGKSTDPRRSAIGHEIATAIRSGEPE